MSGPRYNAAVAVLVLAVCAHSQHPPTSLAGTWQGLAETAGAQLHLAVRLRLDGGRHEGTLELLDERLDGIAVTDIEVAGETVSFAVPWMGARFEGALVTEPRPVLRGHWLPGAGRVPVVLERVAAVRRPVRPQEPRGRAPYRAIDVRIERALAETTIELHGTLTLPAGDGPHPAVVLIAGSGYQQRDATIRGHRPFLVLADRLTRAGVAVLRYDKRGCGQSTGRLREATSRDLADDAEAVLRWLRRHTAIDPARTGLLGHSEGGMLAPMIAARSERGAVRFVVSLAGPGVSGSASMVLQAELMARADGLPEPDVEEMVALRRRVLEIVRRPQRERAAAIASSASDTWVRLSDKARELLDDEQNLVARGHRFDSPWMRWALEYDPASDLRRMRCPFLALFGDKDVHVGPRQNVSAIAAALAEGECDDHTVREIAGLNHLFQHSETGSAGEYYDIEETMAEEVLDMVTAWICERVAQ